MAQYQLPNDFFFGAAMSGPQTEGQWNQGGKLENLWDTWSIQDLGSFYNCVGSYAGNDFMAKYQEDLRILKDLGLDTYRTSIQWSRLLDADGNLSGTIDQTALSNYMYSYFIIMGDNGITSYPYVGSNMKSGTYRPHLPEAKGLVYTDDGSRLSVRLEGSSNTCHVVDTYDQFPFAFENCCFHLIDDVL